MADDVVRALGHLALASRLRRIGEQLHLQAQPVIDSCAQNVPASHFPLLVALARSGPLGVVELAEALGIRQPGVTRMLDKLKSSGLVKAARSTGDRRQRPVVLSRAGHELIKRSREQVWPWLEAAVIEACGPNSVLLEQLQELERGLAAEPIKDRVDRLMARGGGRASA